MEAVHWPRKDAMTLVKLADGILLYTDVNDIILRRERLRDPLDQKGSAGHIACETLSFRPVREALDGLTTITKPNQWKTNRIEWHFVKTFTTFGGTVSFSGELQTCAGWQHLEERKNGLNTISEKKCSVKAK